VKNNGKRLLAGSAIVLAITILAPVNAHSAAGSSLWDWYAIPGAAHLSGSGGSYWKTDVSIVNPYDWKSISVVLSFYPEGRSNSGPSRQTTISVPPSGHVTVHDILWNRFGVTGKGHIIATTRDGSYFSVSARTYTGSGGTFGQGILGQKHIGSAGTRAVISGLRDDSSYRSNIGIVNATGSSVQFRVTAFDAGGASRGSKTLTVPSNSSSQLKLSSFSSSFSSGSVEIECLSYSQDIQWVAYGSIVDNLSQDATFVEARFDLQYTHARPSYTNLTGWWQGTISGSSGTRDIAVYIYQKGGLVYTFFYQHVEDFWLYETFTEGYVDGNRMVLTSFYTWTEPCSDQRVSGYNLTFSGSTMSGHIDLSSSHSQCRNGSQNIAISRSYAPAGISSVPEPVRQLQVTRGN